MEFTKVEDTHDEGSQKTDSSTSLKEELNFDDELGSINPTLIKIIGCGGGGSSAVQRMIEDGVSGVQFIVLNTDKQALHKSTAEIRVPIGQKITGGLGAGGNPDVGENAAREDSDRLVKILAGANMVVITAGMGGGTGTGSAPVVAELAHDAGILTIAVVTTPFEFEGTVRMNNALKGIANLRRNVDSLIVLPNDKIFKAVEGIPQRLNFKEQFKLADGLLCAGVKGVTELITKPGAINLDFADLSTVMRNSGDSILGVGRGKGENRINEAVEGAIANPLLENRQIDGARKILINITTNGNFSLEEAQEITNMIRHSANKDANIIFGLAENEDMEDDDLSVTVVATDFDDEDGFATAADQADAQDDSVAQYGEFLSSLGRAADADEEKSEVRYSSVQAATEDSIPQEGEPSAEISSDSTDDANDGTEQKMQEIKMTRDLPAGIKIDPADTNQPAIYRKGIAFGRSIDLSSF